MIGACDRRGVTISREGFVIGPDGIRMSLRDLPSPDCTRWVARRKAQVVLAVRGGLLSLDEVLDRYQLTADEFATWHALWDRHGLNGLRTTQLRTYHAKSGA